MSIASGKVLLLGTAQDGGCPHCGCSCNNCVAAREDRALADLPASIAVISHAEKSFWLVDATPAFPDQLEMVQRICGDYRFAGIFLTHLHIGHYTGLMFLGREVMRAREIPVFASPAVCSFLEDNAPWSQLISHGNIVLNPIAEDENIQITPEISITGIHVPHRDEFADTLAFVVRGATRGLFYCPDIDNWESWRHDLRTFLTNIDYALIDATFFSDKELPETRILEVPHPTVKSSCERLAGLGDKITFIHLNHSNPLYRKGSERDEVLNLGFSIGETGFSWNLSK